MGYPTATTVRRLSRAVHYVESRRRDLTPPHRDLYRPRTGGDSSPPMLFAKVSGNLLKPDGTEWNSFDEDDSWAAYVGGHPCKADGSDEDDTTTVYVILNKPQHTPQGLITTGGQIIGYVPLDGSLTFDLPAEDPEDDPVTTTLAGKAIIGFGCWMDFAPLINQQEWSNP